MRVLCLAALCLLVSFASSSARQPLDSTWDDEPDFPLCRATHDVGDFDFIVTNGGQFGISSLYGSSCFPTDTAALHTEYPRGSYGVYTPHCNFWVGAIVNRDTLVSTADNHEMTPDVAPFGNMRRRSMNNPLKPEYRGAVSEQDYIATYTDTVVWDNDYFRDRIEHRLHKPLGIEIHQESYAWSYDYANDFVLFNCRFKNIGRETLSGICVGLNIWPNVGQYYRRNQGSLDFTDIFDDICGFLPSYPTSYHGCNWIDTVNLAWWADNDGDFITNDPQLKPIPHIGAVRLLNLPGDSLNFSYNWWSNGYWWQTNYIPGYDWGPQTRKHYRQFLVGGQGWPAGDRDKYHILSNGEFDYDQIYTKSKSIGDPVWMPPPSPIVAADITDGLEIEFLLSCGPYLLDPGESLPVVFAVVLGKNFHKNPLNFQQNLIDHYYPDRFYQNVDFSDIANNARWAAWVYDNPGVDTDSDGYAGKYRLCCTDSTIQSIDSTITPWDTVWSPECEKVYYEGDGVPDYRGASPPPAPIFRLKPEIGKIVVRWNGTWSETTKDVFLQKIDFEGYRVYFSLDARETSYCLLASYDRENYDKYVWIDSRREWEVTDIPLTPEQCRCLYGQSCGDSTFNPIDYPRSRPYFLPGFPDSVFYFAPHDRNRSEFGVTTPIHKVYPDQPYPSALIPDSADASELTDDGLFKYFAYEMTIENLLPTVRYYVNVTAFDFGSPKSGLTALETSKALGSQIAYGLPDGQDVVEKNLKAYVYPNPYRIDAGYLDKGYEGRDARWYIPERLRLIHFANLPPKCTISILTLDGDLVRRLDHDKDPFDPAASHDTWDMITRNTQSVVSGIYYWTVEQPDGETQIGKLVIIK